MPEDAPIEVDGDCARERVDRVEVVQLDTAVHEHRADQSPVPKNRQPGGIGNVLNAFGKISSDA